MFRRNFLASLGAGATLHSAVGNRPTNTGYTRKFEPIQPDSFDIGVVYIPFVGHTFGECTGDRTPRVGYYSMANSEAVNRHIDQMQGHGITTLQFNFGEDVDDYRRFRNFSQASLASEINIEVFWTLLRVFQRDLNLEKQIDFIRDEFFSKENYNRYDGRPVVQIWAGGALMWNSEVRKAVLNRFESVPACIQYIRERLTVDGVEPILICGDPTPYYRPEFAAQFDGFTDWFTGLRGGEVPWDEFSSEKRATGRSAKIFAETHEQAFIPTAVPGFDDSVACGSGPARMVPRSQDHLSEMLFRYADSARTRNRINIATFNDWMEGHQIEPGTMDGTSYGTSYLERVAEFALAKMGKSKRCRTEAADHDTTQWVNCNATTVEAKPILSSYTPLEFQFNKTASPGGREIAFWMNDLKLYAEDGEQLANYNIGESGHPVLFTVGSFLPERNNNRTWRWLGGKQQFARLYLPQEIANKSTYAISNGVPATEGITADVVVAGTHVDDIEFNRDGFQDYKFRMTAETPTPTSTQSPTSTTTPTVTDTSPGTVSESHTVSSTTTAHPSTRTETTSNGFGVAATLLGTGIASYLLSKEESS